MNNKLVTVYTGNGVLDAEMIRAFLASNGIDAQILSQSIGVAYGLTVGSLGEVEVLCPAEQAEEAARILADMEAGKYETGVDLTGVDSTAPDGES